MRYKFGEAAVDVVWLLLGIVGVLIVAVISVLIIPEHANILTRAYPIVILILMLIKIVTSSNDQIYMGRHVVWFTIGLIIYHIGLSDVDVKQIVIKLAIVVAIALGRLMYALI